MQTYKLRDAGYLFSGQAHYEESLNLSRISIRVVQNPVSSQTDKLMSGTKFSDYLGLNHYKKAIKLKHFIHLRLAQYPQYIQ